MNKMPWMVVDDWAKQTAIDILGCFHCVDIYGIPKGGIIPASLVFGHLKSLSSDPSLISMKEDLEGFGTYSESERRAVFIDDIVDSGATRDRFLKGIPSAKFYAVIDKTKPGESKGWVSFPWERMIPESPLKDNLTRVLQYIGEDPEREGLKETPDRIVKSYDELFAGYREDPGKWLKVFEDDTSDEMVVLKNIEFYSTCEHHFLPFFGRAHIAYIPDGKVIGVSKLARILETFSRRLQIQERICQQVTSFLDDNLLPRGSACVLEAQHFCMTSRGVSKQNSLMVTSSLTGAFRQAETRAEFFQIIRGT